MSSDPFRKRVLAVAKVAVREKRGAACGRARGAIAQWSEELFAAVDVFEG